MKRTRSRATRSMIYLALTLGVWLGGSPFVALAQDGYIPPDRGLPGRREGGGTRGNCASDSQPMMALIPESNFGVTVSDSPTLYWFVPRVQAPYAEFVLLDEADNEVYSTEMPITGSGIVGLNIPAVDGKSVLETGKYYHWYFSLVCNPVDRSGDIFAEGWIRRIEKGTDLTTLLVTTPERDRPNVYVNAGIWHDALDSMAALRCVPGANADFANRWRSLLQTVGLDNLAEAPLIGTCEPSTSQPSLQPSTQPAPQASPQRRRFRLP